MSRPAERPRVLPYGDRAVLLELEGPAAVLDWRAALRACSLPEIGDVVAGGRTLLVVAAEQVSLTELRTALATVEPEPGSASTTSGGSEDEPVEIPVRYDGADLAEVAELTGLDVEDVVAAHTGQTWQVAFAGFAPGFAYLLGEDSRLRVPRRSRSRTEVPAGAVGLADEFSGVYPRSSPGGWQLIGTTDAVLWDPERDPPALLGEGSRVRFVRVGSAEGPGS